VERINGSYTGDAGQDGELAYLQLGRAFVMSGDRSRARKAYQNFLALLKDADPEISVLKQAREEFAML
jgi:hypothetical protein